MICNPTASVPQVRIERAGHNGLEPVYRILFDGDALPSTWTSDEVDLALSMCPVRVLEDCRKEGAE